uniref:Uncharacterized protein n=1 Tax=Panagrolaimus sp. ES5 TaxID=591445 RepID=A0AC34FPI2_9BILA
MSLMKAVVGKDNASSNVKYKLIDVDPNLHHFHGNRANDLLFRLQLDSGEGMDICNGSVQSTSEIDNAIAEYEIADETDTSFAID